MITKFLFIDLVKINCYISKSIHKQIYFFMQEYAAQADKKNIFEQNE